jgi:thymidylate synthase
MNRLDEQYQRLLKDILEYGVDKKDRTGTGTKSIFGYTIHHNMRNGFPLLTTKKVPFKTMATELMWFLMGDTNIKYLVDNNCHIWDGDAYKRYLDNVKDIEDGKQVEGEDGKVYTYKILTKEQFIDHIKNEDWFAKYWGDLGPIYGAQWRYWQGELDQWDQIKDLISELKTNPDSRRLMVNSWNVGQLHEMVLPPCHYGFQVYTRELSISERVNLFMQGKKVERFLEKITAKDLDNENIPKRAISLMWNQRSVDVFLGLPFNIASYGLLLEMIAREVNMVPEHLIGHLGDTHLYSNHIEQAKEQMSREPKELPTLKMSSGHNFRAAMAGKADEIDLNDFILLGYEPHPTIKAPLSN